MKQGIKASSFESIYAASLKFLDQLSPDATYRVIIDEAVKLVNGDYGTIALRRKASFEKVYSSSPLGLKSKVRPKSNAYRAYIERRPLLLHVNETVEAHPEHLEGGIKSTIIIPLTYKEKGVGVMIVNSTKEHYFSQKDIEILQIFGSIASMAIKKTQLYNEAKNALEIRDLFISIAAHEFRTPLTTLNGYLQLLDNKMKNNKSIEAEWIKQLRWEASRLTRMTADLLTLNRIKAGKYQLEFSEADLTHILAQIQSNFRFLYPNRQLVMENLVNDYQEIKVVADADKLIQVFTNILDNAAKFSLPDSVINIIFSIDPKKEYVSIQIEDHGEGIQIKNLNNIFSGFYKPEEHFNTKNGLGLGLFLSKFIIKEHHGSMNVSSKKGLGTKIDIKLPLLSYD